MNNQKNDSASSQAVRSPHDSVMAIPDRLPAETVRRFSSIEPWRALLAIASEWLGVAAAIWFGVVLLNGDRWSLYLVYPLIVVFIAGRQQALTVIGHDASHFRLLRGKALNDWVADLLVMWPVFLTVEGYRSPHGKHHRFNQQEGDGNRKLWGTHDADGNLRPEWQYPKAPGDLVRTLLRRMAFTNGVRWMYRGFLAPFRAGPRTLRVARVVYVSVLVALLFWLNGWLAFLLFWIVPYCTWHICIQYIRLICEHSAVRSEDPRYRLTRSTIPPLWQRLLILPRNIGYHLEHHWYPTVPFYNLPKLHAALMENTNFRRHACISYSVFDSLRECTGQQSASPTPA